MDFEVYNPHIGVTDLLLVAESSKVRLRSEPVPPPDAADVVTDGSGSTTLEGAIWSRRAITSRKTAGRRFCCFRFPIRVSPSATYSSPRQSRAASRTVLGKGDGGRVMGKEK